MPNPNYQKNKKIFTIVGVCLLLIGFTLTVVGFVNFFSALSDREPPSLFWCCFLGLPLCGIGGGLTVFGFRKEILKNAAEQSAEAVKVIVNAVNEANEEMKEDKISCECGAKNDLDANFCKNCGKDL